MAKFDEMLAQVTPYVPEAPNPAIRQAIFDAYFEFCKNTRYWEAPLFPSMTEANEPDFYLEPLIEGDARVYDVLVLSIDGKPLEAGDFHRAQKFGDRHCRSEMYKLRSDNLLTLYPTPDRPYEITGEVILVPRSGTETIDQEIFDNFAMGLRHGAIYTLASMPNKAWSNPQQVQDSLGHYAREMENAKNLVSGRDRKKIRVTTYGGL